MSARALPTALAVLLPAAIVAAAADALSATDEHQPSEAAKRFDAELAAHPPDVVILGNSVAATALDVALLRRALPGEPVVHNLQVRQSRQPTWYAILKHRVYGRGHDPDLVIVLDHLETMLETDLPTELARQELLGQMTPDDPVILRKTFGQDDLTPSARRVRRGRADARAFVVDGIKRASVGLLWAQASDGDVADEALGRVFGFDGIDVDFDLHTRVLPVVDTRPEDAPRRAVTPGEELYLPDIARLVREHGGNVVFVRVPAPPSSAWANRTAPETEQALVTLLTDAGAAWLDLSDLPLRDSDFTDFAHFGPTGRLQVTRALARQLAEWDALRAKELPKPSPGARFVGARRVGTPPAPAPVTDLRAVAGGCPVAAPQPASHLSNPALALIDAALSSPFVLLEDGVPLERVTSPPADCAGKSYHAEPGFLFGPRSGAARPERYAVGLSEAFPLTNDEGLSSWWVYPGTRAEIDVAAPEAWGPVEVTVRADTIGAADSMLRAGALSAPFEVVAGLARARLTVPGGRFTVGLDAPRDGGFVALRTVSVRHEGVDDYVLGDAVLAGGRGQRLVGEGSDDRAVYTWAIAPPTFDAPLSFHDGVGSFDVSAFQALQPEDLYAWVGLYWCSPFRVAEAGEVLPGLPWDRKAGDLLPGWLRVRDEVVEFAPLAIPADAPPETWRLVAPPDRKCQRGRWLYPGDTMRVEAPLRGFRVGADRLVVAGVPVGPKGPTVGSVRVRLTAGAVFVDEVVPMAVLAEGDAIFDLHRRLPPDTAGVVLELRSDAGAPWLAVTAVTLAEARPFEGP